MTDQDMGTAPGDGAPYASEQLRKLAETPVTNLTDPSEIHVAVVMRNVLPLIADLVWEAESTCMDCGPCNGGVTDDDCYLCGSLRRVLAALRDSLSAGSPSRSDT